MRGPSGTAIARATCLILLAIAAYLPAMRGGFIWDDHPLVLNNPRLHEAAGLSWLWLIPDFEDYWPLTYTTFWIDWRLWGERPAGYHVENVLLHVATAILVWRLLRRLGVPGAWVCAAIFAVHPVNVAGVAWIIQRKTVLAGLMFFTSLLFYVRYDESERPADYAVALGSYLLALLSKSSVIMLPFLLLGYAAWRRRRIAGRDLVHTLPFLLLTVVLTWISFDVHHRYGVGTEFARPEGFAARLAGAGWIVWFYLFKALIPIHLAFVYPYWSVDPASGWSYLPTLVLVASLLALWRWRQHAWARAGLLGLGYFVVSLAPVLGFVDIAHMYYSLAADHYQYLAIIGIIATAVAAVCAARRRWPTMPRAVAPVLGACVVALLFVQTWRQGYIYKDDDTIWRATLAMNPRAWVADEELGTACFERDQPGQAADHFTAALRTRPRDSELHVRLAAALKRQGRLDDAIRRLAQAAELRPKDAGLHNALGGWWAERGNVVEAVRSYRRALDLLPNEEYLANNVAWMLATSPITEVRDGPEAVRLAEHAVRLVGHDPQLIDTLAAAYAEAGRFDQAAATARRAIECARKWDQDDLVQPFEARLHLYERRRPYRELAPDPPTEDPHVIRIEHGNLRAVFQDNAESPKVLSGIDSLFNVKDAPDFDAYDPDSPGASAGINFEHIIAGHENPNNSFTPRRGPFTMRRLPDGRGVQLVRRAADDPWSVDSTLSYTLVAPHYVDVEFRCRPRDAGKFGNRGCAIFSFCNYMNDAADAALHFRGVEAAGGEEVWIAADAPPGHPHWNQGGTYHHRDAAALDYDPDLRFNLNSWSYDYPRFTLPFYYGRAARDMTLILMFDRAWSVRDEIRFSLFKFKLKRFPRPAWDFEYVVHKVEQDQEYGFRARLVWKRFVSPQDCLDEYGQWAAALTHPTRPQQE